MQTVATQTSLQQFQSPLGAHSSPAQGSLEQCSSSCAPEWDPAQRTAIARAILEAMETSHRDVRSRSRPRPSVDSPRDLLPAPQPHLPLRKASAQRLQTRKGGAPRPLFAPSGIRLSPVQPVPHIDNVNASNEHAFAGRDPRRPFKPPLGNFVDSHAAQGPATNPPERSTSLYDTDGRPPSSPLLPPPPTPHSPRAKGKSLRNARSVGDGPRGLRKKPNAFASMSYSGGGAIGYNKVPPLPSPPLIGVHAIRESYRSAVNSHASIAATSSTGFTDRSSMDPHSSHDDRASGNLHGHNFTFLRGPSTDEDEGAESATDLEMSVDDVLGLYEDGFSSTGRPSCDMRSIRSADRSVVEKNSLDIRSLHSPDRPISQSTSHRAPPATRAHPGHRRSQSASMLLGVNKARLAGGSVGVNRSPSVASPPGRSFSDSRTVNLSSFPARDITSAPQPTATPRPAPVAGNNRAHDSAPVPRDRYGFKKVSHYVTAAQYDAWDAAYTPHLERRARKWHILMRSYGLSVTPAFRFPPKSDKIKRYVRKGIPLEYRGAAWFWYAGGPGVLAKEKGLYAELCRRVENGDLGETDREHIERDLNRTFPDNIKFKPDPSSEPKSGHTEGRSNVDSAIHLDDSPAIPLGSIPPPAVEVEVETPIVQALRRVLQTFAVHNPHIGYCQSLNFIAGLLLLFLDEDEEKTFILLNIVTHTHLPGTHGVALEGANVDIAVLMSCVKDSLPAVWAKLDDKGGGMDHGSGGALRLPTVSLATTAWFMSLFVGTLPIEAVLRIWDCLFFEGSKTLFRVALAIFKFAEPAICSVADPMEIFQLVQQVPRALLDVNALLEVCFRRRAGFAGISQGLIEGRREDRRRAVKDGVRRAIGDGSTYQDEGEGEGRLRRFTRRVRSRTGATK